MTMICTRGQAYEYHLDGKDLFSVSQIRKMAHDSYAGIPFEVLEPARIRGTILHRRFWRLLASRMNLMERPPVIPAYEGYCRSMDDAVERNNILPVKLEQPSFCLKLGYAGTPDGLVRFGPKQKLAIIDLKTGLPQLTDAMQLLAYWEMTDYTDAEGLIDLYIQSDGSFAKEKWVTPAMKATEWAWFLAARSNLISQRNHGV